MGNQADIATPHYDTFQTSSHMAGGLLKLTIQPVSLNPLYVVSVTKYLRFRIAVKNYSWD